MIIVMGETLFFVQTAAVKAAHSRITAPTYIAKSCHTEESIDSEPLNIIRKTTRKTKYGMRLPINSMRN